MSFAVPAVLLALVALPLLVFLYLRHQGRQRRVADAFVTKPLRASVAPQSPGWRRHAPMLAFLVAVAVLIVAAARPERSVAVPVSDGAVMLVDDVSSSMAATDVTPSRLAAARKAAGRFVSDVPGAVRVGVMAFSTMPELLQPPTTDHAAARSTLSQLRPGGHTAIGDAMNRAVAILKALKGPNGKRVPSAIVLLSDGTSTRGADPLSAARAAKAQHIPVYTVALGTARGTIQVGRRTVPVPLDASQLERIAALSGARAFTVGNSGGLSAVYSHLAVQFGHKKERREMTAGFAAAGLGLVLVGGALSLAWFGRLI